MHRSNGRVRGLIDRAIDWLFAQLNEAWNIELHRRRAVPAKHPGR